MSAATRKLPNWIDSFIEYTEAIAAPVIWRRWSAIMAIAGALERKVWVYTSGRNLYPNMYTILVGPPGVGKSASLLECERLWRGLPAHHVAPISVSKASLMDALNDAKRHITVTQPGQIYMEFNSLLVSASELGVLVPGYDNEFMNALTHIYDGAAYEERKRSMKDHIKIPYPQINLFAATTPDYLQGTLPEGAWGQGFMSRTVLVYSGEIQRTSMFTELERQKALAEELLADLRTIGHMQGRFGFTPEYMHMFDKWYLAECEPAPEHPRLTNYNTRRPAHFLKLSMVASVNRGVDRVINLEDFQTAMDWLTEVETAMPDIFKAMSGGGDSKAIDDAWYFMFQAFAKDQKPVLESRLVYFLRERIPSHSIQRVIEVMVRSNMLIPKVVNGLAAYQPAPKKSF